VPFPSAGRDPQGLQPDFVELEVAAVRMNDRVEAPNRGLRADRPVAEPEDDVVILVEDALLHLLVDVGARRGVDRNARFLQESVEIGIVYMAVVEGAGRMPEAVVEEVRLPQCEEVHH
jgi:hypothetical protein